VNKEQTLNELQNHQLNIDCVNGNCVFDATEVKEMYDQLLALFHRSQMNGLVQIDTDDRQQLKRLLKLPENYR